MNFTKTIYALAIGSVGIMGAMSSLNASAAALPTNSYLSIMTGDPVLNSSGAVTNIRVGSWFGMDRNGDATIAGAEKTSLSEGTTGLIIGVTTLAGASHGGAVAPGDTNAITDPWGFFGNTGSDYLSAPVSAIGGDTANGLDFSGWTVTWNGIPAIPMGAGAWGAGYSEGVAKFTWDGVSGSRYDLNYHGTVPLGDPSGFGGVKYALYLRGIVTLVPEASTYGMMLAGLGLVGVMASRRRKSI